MQNDIKGINLLEVLIVVVIIAILVALAIPTLTKTIETARDKEAWTNLRLIRTGEKIYNLEEPYYYPYPGEDPETNIGNINNYLKLRLESGTDWDYEISSASGGADFKAKATRAGTSDGWEIQKGSVITEIGDRPSPPPSD